MKLKRIKLSVLALLIVGHIGIIGKLVGSETIQGLGVLTTASPLPLVFATFRGVEGFASEFSLNYEVNGESVQLKVTPKKYEALRGPYGRRNAYGAAIAGAPMLTGPTEKPMVDSIHKYGFCRGSLKKEFGIPESVRNLTILVRSNTKGAEREWSYPVNCDD